MTVWAFRYPQTKEELDKRVQNKVETIEEIYDFIYKSLLDGIVRYGYSISETANLLEIAKKTEEERTKEEQTTFNACKFLLEITPEDWIVLINIPRYGFVSAAKVIRTYNFEKEPNAYGDFRHLIIVEPTSIITFNRNNPNLPKEVSKTLKLRGKYWRINIEVQDELLKILNMGK